MAKSSFVADVTFKEQTKGTCLNEHNLFTIYIPLHHCCCEGNYKFIQNLCRLG